MSRVGLRRIPDTLDTPVILQSTPPAQIRINESYLDLRTAQKYAPNIEALRSRVKGIEVKSDTLVSKGR